MINFPNNPAFGDAFTLGGTIYTCVSTAPIVWNAAPAAAAIADAPTDGKTYGRNTALWKALTKSDVGLDQVDNTADNNKPVSGPQGVALEPKIVAATALYYWRGDKTWQILDKAAVGLGSVDNTADANKSVYAASYANGQRFDWANNNNNPTYLWGADNNGVAYIAWRAGMSVSYADSANYANSAGSAPANGGTAQNSNQVGGIGGWNYSGVGNNPPWLWSTDGNSQYQFLTAPNTLSVNYANSCDYSNRTGTVNNASGGYINGTINAFGYTGRQGNAGATTNIMNTAWVGNSVQQWVDGSFIGNINMNISDERIKKNISPLARDHDSFMGIVPIKYGFKDVSIWTDDGVEHWGWSAQNIASTLPIALVGGFEAKTLDGDIQPAGVDERPILTLTVLEVQALWAEVAALRERIAVLEA
jgi:hypothetical protein